MSRLVFGEKVKGIMFYRRIVVYVPDEETYKALKHKVVDEGLTLNALMLKLIRQYLNGDSKKPISTKTPARQGGAPEAIMPVTLT